MTMTLEEQMAHCDGKDCNCYAYGQCECACGADWTSAEVYRLRHERDELRKVCAATYQAAGCYGLPERFKDALSNAMHGENLHDVDLDELLPVDPIDWVERAEKAEAELDALKQRIAKGRIVRSTRNGVIRTPVGYCEPNTDYTIITDANPLSGGLSTFPVQ